MRTALRCVFSLVIAAACMLAFRSLVFTVCSIDGDALAPFFLRGDRIVVNRWSYGLRTGRNNSIFGYGRLFRQPLKRGDIVAFDSPIDSFPGVLVCRCTALPGDTVRTTGSNIIILPGTITCDDQDCYWMQALSKGSHADSNTFGPIPDSLIIGRVCAILYNHDDSQPFFRGYDKNRLTLIP